MCWAEEIAIVHSASVIQLVQPFLLGVFCVKQHEIKLTLLLIHQFMVLTCLLLGDYGIGQAPLSETNFF